MKFAVFIILFTTPLLIFLSSAGHTGRWMVALTSGVSLALCLLLMRGIERLSPLKVPLIICASFALQLVLFLLSGLLDFPTIIDSSSLRPDYGSFYLNAILPLLIIPIATLFSVLILRLFLPHPPAQLLTGTKPIARDHRFITFLFATGLIYLLYWPATAGLGTIGYFIRVLWQSLLGVTFFAGFYASEHRKLRLFWMTIFIISLFFAFVLGGRGYAFRPFALFVFGWFFAAWRGGQRKALFTLFAISVFAIVAFGFIGMIRDDIGRGSFDDFSAQRVSTVIDTSTDYLTTNQSDGTDESSSLQNAVRRARIATNPAVTILTDHVIPRRGLESLPDEIAGSFDLALFSGRTKIDRIEDGLGTSSAIRYGFRVTAETNVPMPLLADGWSRAGPWGAFLFGLIVSFIMVFLEWVARSIDRIPNPVRVATVSVLGFAALFSINSDPLVSLLRQLILYIPFAVIVVYISDLVTTQLFGLNRHSRRNFLKKRDLLL